MSVHAFSDPVFDSQRVFRTAMNALARPGKLQPFDPGVRPPEALPAEIAALALTLADHETPLWLDAVLTEARDVADYLRFHTGAPIVSRPVEAAFALVCDTALCPALMSFTLGTAEYPDRSTTVLIQTDTLRSPDALTLRGPGIAGTSVLRAEPLPPGFVREWSENRRYFPRGVDVLMAAEGWLVGLPRTTEISEA